MGSKLFQEQLYQEVMEAIMMLKEVFLVLK